MESLPSEILSTILCMLDPEQAAYVMPRVCRRFARLPRFQAGVSGKFRGALALSPHLRLIADGRCALLLCRRGSVIFRLDFRSLCINSGTGVPLVFPSGPESFWVMSERRPRVLARFRVRGERLVRDATLRVPPGTQLGSVLGFRGHATEQRVALKLALELGLLVLEWKRGSEQVHAIAWDSFEHVPLPPLFQRTLAPPPSSFLARAHAIALDRECGHTVLLWQRGFAFVVLAALKQERRVVRFPAPVVVASERLIALNNGGVYRLRDGAFFAFHGDTRVLEAAAFEQAVALRSSSNILVWHFESGHVAEYPDASHVLYAGSDLCVWVKGGTTLCWGDNEAVFGPHSAGWKPPPAVWSADGRLLFWKHSPYSILVVQLLSTGLQWDKIEGEEVRIFGDSIVVCGRLFVELYHPAGTDVPVERPKEFASSAERLLATATLLAQQLGRMSQSTTVGRVHGTVGSVWTVAGGWNRPDACSAELIKGETFLMSNMAVDVATGESTRLHRFSTKAWTWDPASQLVASGSGAFYDATTREAVFQVCGACPGRPVLLRDGTVAFVGRHRVYIADARARCKRSERLTCL